MTRAVAEGGPGREFDLLLRVQILVEYTKGGKDYEMKQLATVTFDPDFGLKK